MSVYNSETLEDLEGVVGVEGSGWVLIYLKYSVKSLRMAFMFWRKDRPPGCLGA